ncbi:transposase family protein [Streptomyces filipinensis]|uniref:transposase family protein n=1 Tax=Streptomyces filipinensis TaxID=66887 RepID=UPI0036E3F893
MTFSYVDRERSRGGPAAAGVPRARQGGRRRHPLAFVLALAACAVLAGAKSLTAIAEWAADAPAAVLTALGGPSREPAGPTAPTEATVRRILQRVDGDALDAAIGAWLAARDPHRPPPDHDLGRRARRSLAVDGKTVRGAPRRRHPGPPSGRDDRDRPGRSPA